MTCQQKSTKFSIVTPFYNNSNDNINKTYESVINQTNDNWEWIITDDFSTDDTKDKILKFQSDKIKYVEQKSKKELFFNPQTYSNADIIVQLDSDDEMYPKALEVYEHFFNKYPDVLLMSCSTNYYKDDIYTDSHIIYQGEYNNCLDKKIAKDKNYKNSFNFLRINGAWGNLQAWRNIDIDFNPYKFQNLIYMDKYRALTLEEKGKYLHLPRTLYRNNIRKNGVSHRQMTNDESIEYAICYEKIKDRRKDKINSYVKIFDELFLESIPFLYSDLNLVKDKKNISIFGDIKNRELLKELYFDHNLFFNEKRDDIDYYFNIDENSDIKKLWIER